MVVLIVDDVRIGAYEFERDTPIPADPYRPRVFSNTLKRMKFQARKAHIFGFRSRIQRTEYQPQPFGMLWLNSGLCTGFIELRETFVFERSDHNGPL
jgi:hypothetical protein